MENEQNADVWRLVYGLMSRAFLNIRVAAHEDKGQKGIFKLADLFHNVPARLERLEREGSGFDELMNQVFAHADRNGSRAWLDDAISKVA